MNLQEILLSNSDLNITLKSSDLIEVIEYCVNKTKIDLEQLIVADKTETYHSPKEACKILNVNASTLWRWNKQGYLCPAMVGGKRCYKMSELKSILNGGRKA